MVIRTVTLFPSSATPSPTSALPLWGLRPTRLVCRRRLALIDHPPRLAMYIPLHRRTPCLHWRLRGCRRLSDLRLLRVVSRASLALKPFPFLFSKRPHVREFSDSSCLFFCLAHHDLIHSCVAFLTRIGPILMTLSSHSDIRLLIAVQYYSYVYSIRSWTQHSCSSDCDLNLSHLAPCICHNPIDHVIHNTYIVPVSC